MRSSPGRHGSNKMRIAVQGRSKHQIMMSNEYRGIFLNKLNYLNYSLSVKGHFALDVLVALEPLKVIHTGQICNNCE